jgi:hypothetical protein
MSYFNDKKVGDPQWSAGDEEHDAALAQSGVAVEAACRFRALATRWLVQDVVPHEAVTVIAGAAGAGKTFFACQLAADAARQCRYRVVVATSGYERPELLRWRLDQAQGDARGIVFARLTPPKGIKDRRPAPTEEEITERLAILYHTIEGAADPESGMLPAEGSGLEKAEGKRQTAEEDSGDREGASAHVGGAHGQCKMQNAKCKLQIAN